MKVPFNAPKTQNSRINNATNTSNLCYEPKSVLDLCRSPSPPAAVSVITDVVSQSDDPSLQWVDHILLNNSEDWDSLSLIGELGLPDDSNVLALKSNSQFHNPESFDPTRLVPTDFTLSDIIHSSQSLNQSFGLGNELSHMNQWNSEFDFVDELVRAAECLDSDELPLGHVILARLNQQLESPIGKPLRRAAYYFTEALQTLLSGSTRSSSSSEIVQTIKAYKIFSNISPIVMFSNFTANQAILEAVDGSPIVHVVDFEIGLGGHWASFMKEIAEKADSRKSNPPVLRITAVVSDDYAIESRLIRENLSQFAGDLKIGFDIDFVLIRTFEFLSFQAFKFVEGEKIAVLLSPAIFRRIGVGFLTDLRRISPHVVVYVDGEGLMETSSFRRSVIDGLEFYSTVLESLEAASGGGGGGGGDWIGRIEMFVLRPKILAAVEAAVGRSGPPWRQAIVAAGLRPVALSRFADFQADCLLRRLQVGGFHVAKRQAEMVLCWHERALIATSVWRC